MTTAKELLDAGRLTDAIQELNQVLRTRPADSQSRIFLFELLSFAGEFDRADKQLDILATHSGDAGRELALQVYRNLIAGEKLRRQVFAGAALPKFLLTPPPAVEQYVVLLSRINQGGELAELLGAAEEATPALAGRIGDVTFQHFRDADDRVAPVLEAFHGSDYLWLPFEQIKRIDITPPRRLRELLWVAATVEVHGQPAGELFIPALYVNSHQHENPQVRLGRMTEWEAVGDQLVTGKGQRVFLADDNERALLDLTAIEFDGIAEGSAS